MKEQYRIAAKRSLTPEIGQISVEAPLIAAKAKADLDGQVLEQPGKPIPAACGRGERLAALDAQNAVLLENADAAGIVAGHMDASVQGGGQAHVLADKVDID